MSNVSIYEKNWTDLVFEDKNKAYGAYQLRQQNARTTLFAFFGGILLIFSLIGGWLLFSSFGEKATVAPIFEDEEVVIKITNYNRPKPDMPKPMAPIAIRKSVVKDNIDKKDLLNPTIVKKDDNPDDLKTNKEMKENPTDAKTTEGTSTIGTTTSSTATTGTATTGTAKEGPDNNPKSTYELDRLPEYPGGIKEFYKYVGNNIEKPEVDESAGTMISVLMSFVIEKNGTMTDIKVVRSTDKNLEKEAIRVLKALKVKWSPGYMGGDKVRTQYTLPIKVAL